MHRFWNLETSNRVVLAVVAACALVPLSVAADDLCGSTIVANLKLHHDLTCPADGLIVGADGIKLNLNGHTITGSGGGVGINVNGRTNVSISGGTVQQFATGVLVFNST